MPDSDSPATTPTPRVAVLRTRPESVLEDYARLLDLLDYRRHLDPEATTLLKLNLSWTKYFPACSSQPWQLEGVAQKLLKDGMPADRLLPIENKTVVTDPRKGARFNKWMPILEACGLPFQPLTEVEWTVHTFQQPLLKLDQIFPEGIQIPKIYAGTNIVHLPTLKTHGHSITTLSLIHISSPRDRS